MLKAIDLIEQDISAGNDPRDRWSAAERPVLMARDLPEPRLCNPEYCSVDEAPSCLNYELPTFGFWGARVEDPADDLNPYGADATGRWSQWTENKGIFKMVGRQDEAIFKV